uniref:Uncharacterized protein n=1 Tax=Onchocerca volvulus TaxID=6282 RepID=A0A8R1TIB9_ONCVO
MKRPEFFPQNSTLVCNCYVSVHLNNIEVWQDISARAMTLEKKLLGIEFLDLFRNNSVKQCLRIIVQKVKSNKIRNALHSLIFLDFALLLKIFQILMTNSLDTVITQIKKEDIDVENQCFAVEEFKNGNDLCRPSTNSSNDRTQTNIYKNVTAYGLFSSTDILHDD